MPILTVLLVVLVFAIIVSLVLWAIGSAPPQILNPLVKVWVRWIVIVVAVVVAVVWLWQFVPTSGATVVVPIHGHAR